MDIIYGYFKSKKGITWHYNVNPETGYAEMWHENIVRCTGGWKQGKDTIKVATKELRDYIKEKHGIECVDYDMYNDTKVKRTPYLATDTGYWHNGKHHRDYEDRVVWEEVGTGLLMVKNRGWNGVGTIVRADGRTIVKPHGGIKLYDTESHRYID